MFLSHQKITFSHLVVISIVNINTEFFFKPQYFQRVNNFKFKAMYSTTFHCHVPAKHECYVLQDSAETIQVRWETFTSCYEKFSQENMY